MEDWARATGCESWIFKRFLNMIKGGGGAKLINYDVADEWGGNGANARVTAFYDI